MTTTDLSDLLTAQRQLQIDSFKLDPCKMTDDERAEFLRWNVLALEDELHEMLNEVGWKPWATSRHVNAEPAMKEMVDALHFFMNILLALGACHPHVSSETQLARHLAALYFKKREVNAVRQAVGYDGVSSKCPSCHRELAEVEFIRLDGDRACPCGYVLERGVEPTLLNGDYEVVPITTATASETIRRVAEAAVETGVQLQRVEEVSILLPCGHPTPRPPDHGATITCYCQKRWRVQRDAGGASWVARQLTD